MSRTILLVALLTTTVTAMAQSQPSGQFTSVSLKEACVDFAMDPATGNLAGINSDNNTVTLYSRDFLDAKAGAVVVGPVKIGHAPARILHKQCGDKSYFIVLCKNDGRILVLDSIKLDVVKGIQLKDATVDCISAALAAGDPYVYYSNTDESRQGSVGRINLATLSDEGSVSVISRWHTSGEITVSANGKWMFVRSSGSPTGLQSFQLAKAANGKDEWQESFYDHKDTSFYLSDPFSYYTASGDTLFSLDLRQNMATLSFTPRAFFADRPVILGARKVNAVKSPAPAVRSSKNSTSRTAAVAAAPEQTGLILVAASYNDFKVHGEVRIPASVIPAASESGNFRRREALGTRAYIFADGRGNRAIVAAEGQVALVPLASLSVPVEPLLVASVDAPATVSVGQPVTIKVQPFDAKTQVSLASGPQGMTLSNGALNWTPSEAQVGDTKVELKLSSGASERIQALDTIAVTQAFAPLPFAPDGVRLDAGGKLAVVWVGQQESPRAMPRNGREHKIALAVVDVEQRKVLVERTLTKPIGAVALAGDQVYIALADADRIESYLIKTLEPGPSVTVEGRTARLWAAPPRCIIAFSEREYQAFSLPDLKPVNAPAFKKDPNASYMLDTDSFARIDDAYACGNALYNSDFTKVRLMTRCPLPRAIAVDERNAQAEFTGLPSLGTRSGSCQWNRRIVGNDLVSGSGQRVAAAATSLGGAAILHDVPVMVSLAHDQSQKIRSLGMKLFDLAHGSVVQDVKLYHRTLPSDTLGSGMAGISDEDAPPMQFSGSESLCMDGAGKRIVVLAGKRLYICNLSDDLLKKFTMPLAFEIPQEVPLVSSKQPLKIAHKMRGGEAPVEFSMGVELPGVTLDKASGSVTIDGPAIAKAAIKRIGDEVTSGRAMSFAQQVGGNNMGNTENNLPEELTMNKNFVTEQLGRPAQGYPTMIPIWIVATDKNGQKADLKYTAVLELPQADVMKPINDFVAQQQRDEQQRQKTSQQEYTKREQERQATTQRAALEDDKLRRLEKRLDDMEAKIDLLTKMLQSK